MSSHSSANRSAHRAIFSAVQADPERRLLNMREQAAVIAAHGVELWQHGDPGRRLWAGACTCGVEFVGNRVQVEASRDSHVRDELERAKGRKVAEAKARAALDDEIERALVETHRATR